MLGELHSFYYMLMYQYNLIFYVLKSFLFSIPLWVLIVLSCKIIYNKHLKV